MQVFVNVGVGQPWNEDAVLIERHVAFVRQQESGEEHGNHALAHAERRGGPHRRDIDGLHAGVDAREHLLRLVPELHESARVLFGRRHETPDAVGVLSVEAGGFQERLIEAAFRREAVDAERGLFLVGEHAVEQVSPSLDAVARRAFPIDQFAPNFGSRFVDHGGKVGSHLR